MVSETFVPETPLHETSAANPIAWGIALLVGAQLLGGLVAASTMSYQDESVLGPGLVVTALVSLAGAVAIAIGAYRLAAKADAAFALYVTRTASAQDPPAAGSPPEAPSP